MTRFGLQAGGRRGRDAREGAPEPVSGRTHARRHRVLTCAFTALSLAYGARLGYLQLLEGSELRSRATAQSFEEREIPAARGRILARDGQPLVTDAMRYHAFLAPKELKLDREEALDAIESVLPLPAGRRARLAGATGGWQSIATGVTDEERLQLVARIGPGVRFEASPGRRFPHGDVARRLIGRTSPEGVGQSGVELELDSLLRGEPGARRIRVAANQEAFRSPDDVIREARPGFDVTLTIDPELQRIAENELARALARTGATAGDIILYDPRTGELLAVASDKDGASASAIPAFTDPYEPGSTAKPFLLAALLSEGLVDLDEVIDVDGGRMRDRFRTISDVHGHDRLSVRQVIAQSSNVGAAKLSTRLRDAVQQSYLRDFGFGRATLLDYPGESAGRLRRPSEWTELSAASHAMGYEMSVTSLQLVAAYGAIANDGRLMRPRLIREIRDAGGRVVWASAPEPVRQVIRPEIARQVGGVLESVVQEGTATLAGMASLRVAGKTGTAKLAVDGRYVDGRYRASFVGYAPADDPRVVILTRLEDPKGAYYGGAIAAPTSHATLQAALATRVAAVDRRLVAADVQPRRWSGAEPAREARGPFVFAVGASEQAWGGGDAGSEPSIQLPNLRGVPLRSAVARLHELGLRVQWLGTGAVTDQEPAPGRELPRGATVILK